MSADELVERLVALCGTHPDAVAARMMAMEIIEEIKREIVEEPKKRRTANEVRDVVYQS